jgi:hypothetical protein
LSHRDYGNHILEIGRGTSGLKGLVAALLQLVFAGREDHVHI